MATLMLTEHMYKVKGDRERSNGLWRLASNQDGRDIKRSFLAPRSLARLDYKSSIAPLGDVAWD
jgi:hypothetical protein